MPKIIQIIEFEEHNRVGETEKILLGLGDDGVTYKLDWDKRWRVYAPALEESPN